MNIKKLSLLVAVLALSSCGANNPSSSDTSKVEVSSSEVVSSSKEEVSSSEVVSSSKEEVSSSEVISSSQEQETMKHDNVTTSIYPLKKDDKTLVNGRVEIKPVFNGEAQKFTASFEGSNIRIDEIGGKKYITALKAGTTTKVTLNSTGGLSCTFDVKVSSSNYKATGARDAKFASSEGWFTSTKVNEISNMGKDFMNGFDISTCKALYQNGTKFFNKSNVEQSLFYILKDNGVNWIRLKLWVDPYTAEGVSYGGGESDLPNTLWMAYEAKKAGLNLLLDFHYSDYWTHPGQQILPKSWNSCSSKEALCAKIKSYTTETLTTFKNSGCLPDMVQLGNEISSGIYLQKFTGSSDTLDNYGQPTYLTGKTNYSYGTKDASQYVDYIKAASEGVNAVSSSIKKVIHWAKGSQISASIINNFFNNMPSSYYDYAAISFYPYYCFDSMNAAKTIINGLNLSKPWFVAETAYPFSGSSYVYENSKDVTNFTVSDWTTSGITNIKSEYAFTPAGQAKLIHDLTSAVVDKGGKGIFYWEAAWVPNLNVGWAGKGSLNTYGNQTFFSYDGKATANLDLFQQMSPHI
ncbi:MAG: hypothetical protein E7178_00195 [Erysipelotrichaceae bacterium]|nr:hypothetical protein [Erysipelotrichaceae bacterium]